VKLPTPRVTIALTAITVLVSLAVLLTGNGPWAGHVGGFIAARVGGATGSPGALPVWVTPLSATLLHGSAVHLMFNIVVLVYCGRSVELALGSARLFVLYVVSAYAAVVGQYLSGPGDPTPMIGASGAVSGLLAAHAVLYGDRPAYHGRLASQAVIQVLWLFAAWVGIQLLTGVAFHGSMAIGAHIGGFAAGLLLVKPLLRWRHRGAR